MVNRPNRRKSKDNPYTLLKIEEKQIYIVSFKDSRGILKQVEITKEVYDAFDNFELDDKSQMNKYERHIEYSEMNEEDLYNRSINRPIELEDFVIRQSSFLKLKKAINRLPEIQKRRIIKYYFDNKTEQQIADEENATHQSVHIILVRAVENLKKLLKN